MSGEAALDGIKVLEYGEFIAAPYAAKLFADMGADVVKIEKPGRGDKARRHGPFAGNSPHPERSGLFLNLNTNKRGITLDIGTRTGLDMFYELCKQADVLIASQTPEEARRLGIDHETLRALNPRLVVTSVTVFGHSGPYKNYRGH